MDRVLVAVSQLIRIDEGQDLIEYALLAMLIAVVVLASVGTVGNTIMNVFWQPIAQNF
jgi:Flp pilus assembly pilin Flp